MDLGKEEALWTIAIVTSDIYGALSARSSTFLISFDLTSDYDFVDIGRKDVADWNSIGDCQCFSDFVLRAKSVC